jgi:hypothetical protein
MKGRPRPTQTKEKPVIENAPQIKTKAGGGKRTETNGGKRTQTAGLPVTETALLAAGGNRTTIYISGGPAV